MRNIQIIIEYDGSNYCGWQRQENGISVQQKLEEAVVSITKEKSVLIGASRTDAGVHALGQSGNFHTNSSIPIEKFAFAINSVLPMDISVIKAIERKNDFHSRYHARQKTYVYQIFTRRIASPFLKNYAYHCLYDLDFEKMREASKYIVGEHDFTAFMASGSQSKIFVRTIYEINIQKENDLILIEVTGNGFLYNMVRILSGTLLYAAIGKMKPSDIKTIIQNKDRTLAGATLPACGLYLKEIVY
jgi:tRNA pseudouridine38-40 synthase